MLFQSHSASARRYDGSGPLWVGLHGFMDSSEVWNNPELPRPLFAPDLPGWGGTLSVPGHTSMWIDWLQETLREYKIEDFYFIGHSLGGGLALAAASRLRPRGMLLLAPLGIGTSRLPGTIMRARPLLQEAHRAMQIPFVVDAAYKALFSDRSISNDLRNRLRNQSKVVARGALRAMPVVHEISSSEYSFAGPVEILWGKNDHILKLQEKRLQHLPEARLEMLDCGHDVVREKPFSVRQAAGRLLER